MSKNITLVGLRADLAAMRRLFKKSFWLLILFAGAWASITFVGMPTVSRSIRLVELGQTRLVTIESGIDKTGPSTWNQPALRDIRARIVGNPTEFVADKLYKKGQQAFLTYSERLNYGVVTDAPPSFFDILVADQGTYFIAFFGIVAICILTFTNVGLILLGVLEHFIDPDTIGRIRAAQGWLASALLIGTISLEGLLAATLSFLPIAAILAAFSISLKLPDDSPRAMYVIYASLLLFLASHVAGGAVIGLLKFLRTKLGRGLKEVAAKIVALLAALQVVIKIVSLTFSDRVINLSSWRDVAREFVRTLF